MSNYPRTFSHIGISVPDVEKAAKFYSDVMGWYHIMEPTVIDEEADTPIGQMCIDVFGGGWDSFKIAHTPVAGVRRLKEKMKIGFCPPLTVY